jgi:Kef-type K+ transport system membrane component KefB
LQRSDWIVIGVVLILDVISTIAIAIITLLAGPVWLEFVVMLAMFIVTLLGAYWVLFAPEDIPKEHGGDERRE